MRRLAALALLLALAAPAAAAPPASVESDGDTGSVALRRPRAFEFSATVEYVSKYVQTGEAADVMKTTGAYATPAFREELSATDGRTTLSLWTSRHAGNDLGLRGKLTDVDYAVDRAFTLGAVALNAGFTHLRYPNSGFQPAREGYLSFAFDGPLSPSASLYWYSYPGDGVYPSLFLGLSRTFGAFTLEGSAGFYPARTNGYFYEVREGGFSDASLSLSLPFALDEATTLTTSLSGSVTTKRALREVQEGEDNVWVGVSLRRVF